MITIHRLLLSARTTCILIDYRCLSLLNHDLVGIYSQILHYIKAALIAEVPDVRLAC